MSKYFGADEADKAIATLQRKADDWFDNTLSNNYIDKVKMSWNAYHGVFYSDGHKITYGGQKGELVNLPVNHYRNIATHILNMVTANRPSFQARSTNTDSKSEIQTELANGLLDYYMREKRLERYLNKAVEYAIVLGSGYIKMDWNATSGNIHDYLEVEPVLNDETGEYEEREPMPIFEGDIQFRNMSPFDVVFDSTKESSEDHDWVLCRTFRNKYDLAAKYPEFEDEIKALATKTELENHNITSNDSYDETDDIPIYEFYHKATESLPQGRYLVYLSEEIILNDNIMPYRDIPVFRISSADILGTPYGYSPMFDLLPLQDILNSLHSTVATNQNAFGVQNVLNPRGNDVRLQQVTEGLNFIEYNSSVGEPKALNLTQTPREIFEYMAKIERDMETISGVNSVARGNPETSLKSGTALALVQSQALQFMSKLQQSYIQLIEDVGTGLINLLRDFAAVPRVAAIAGLDNRAKMVDFKGDDLDTINRVIVDAGNALANSTAGKVQMAEQLLQMKLISTPEQYLEVMNTGKLSSMTKGDMDELTLIRKENEKLLTGQTEVLAVWSDKHSLHIRIHRAVLADPEMRVTNPDLIERASAHIQEHINLLQTTDPNALALIGEQPLGPSSGTPVSPENAAPSNPPNSSMGQVPNQMANSDAAGVGAGANELAMPDSNPKNILPQSAQAPQTAINGMPTNPKDIPLKS